MTTPKIEFQKLSHSSPVAIFSLYANMYTLQTVERSG